MVDLKDLNKISEINLRYRIRLGFNKQRSPEFLAKEE